MIEKTILGKTGIEVTRLGFGGIPIQRVSEKVAIDTVVRALEKGIDFIDTARAYTVSEGRIGKAIIQAGKRPVLSSKSQQRSAEGILKHIDQSLKELGVDMIDIYHCHEVSKEEVYRKIIGPGGAMEGLIRARDEGKIRFIGITSHSIDLLDKIIDDGYVDCIMVCFSFLEPSAITRVIPKAIEKEIGVIAMKPLSGGAIEDYTIGLKYVLSFKDILPIVGMESPSMVDRNWEVFLSSDRYITKEEEKKIERIREEFGKRFCRRCDYCQPCSEEIPIQYVLGIKYIIKRMGIGVLDRKWIQDALEKANKCTECGKCMERCPYELPIPDLIKESLKWVEEEKSKRKEMK
jgi:predicted aldo/keto reductase-like oxidoreductase